MPQPLAVQLDAYSLADGRKTNHHPRATALFRQDSTKPCEWSSGHPHLISDDQKVGVAGKRPGPPNSFEHGAYCIELGFFDLGGFAVHPHHVDESGSRKNRADRVPLASDEEVAGKSGTLTVTVRSAHRLRLSRSGR